MKVFRYIVIVNLKPFDKKFEIINSFTHYWNAFKCTRLLRERAIIIDIERMELMPLVWVNGKILPTESGKYWYVYRLNELRLLGSEPFLAKFSKDMNKWYELEHYPHDILPKFWAKKNDLNSMSSFLRGDYK